MGVTMKERLIKLLYDYSVKGRVVDASLIEEVIDLSVKEKRLKDYVANIQFTSEKVETNNGLVLASYSRSNKRITLCWPVAMELNLLLKKYHRLFNSFEQSLCYNVFIIKAILHELEHVYQIKILNEASNNSKYAQIMRETYNLSSLEISSEDESKVFDLIYQTHYRIIPSERLAEINSGFEMLEVLKQIQAIIPNLYEFVATVYLEDCLSGYSDKTPGEEYFKAIKRLNFYNEMKDSTKNDSLRLRLMYGMPISESEKNKLVRCIKVSNKHNFKKR